MHYFATVARGLEELAAQELTALGATDVEPTFTGVTFTGDRPLLYRVNLWARIPFRVLMRIHESRCATAKQLYEGIQEVDWSHYLTPDQTFSVRVTGKNSQLNHSHFTALQVKNAIVDQQRQQFSQRSSIDTEQPDLAINVHIDVRRCTVSLDSSGNSLHRRGYRPAMGVAPLKETLAAALVEMTGWSPEQPFLDPLCGSGTLPIEAALKALNVAPGLFRDTFAFEQWRDFDADLWQQMRQEAEEQRRSQLPSLIAGSDADPGALEQAQFNAHQCGVDAHIQWQQQELEWLEPPAQAGVILCNPPYGERIGDVQALREFYALMGDIFKQRFKGWTAYVLCGNLDLAKCIGLKATRRLVVFNGSIECRLLKYELY